ncbi:MAG TPA: hypothetical protein VFN57_14475 [Thermomicrobiaceae bacterium]|nr:hypothetical protein [Thermomicrobiaceae bacterium]
MPRTPNLAAAADFIWRTARLIDRHRYARLFEEAASEPVVSALRPYQNPDGGFGNALEPDLRGPTSQPVPTWTALVVLAEVDALNDPMVPRALDYLASITTAEGGVPFVLPAVRDHPHAPWWETTDDLTASLNPTACIAGTLMAGGIEHPWVERATAYCWRAIAAIDATSPYEMRAVLPFLDGATDRARAEAAFARVGPKLLEQGLVELDPHAPGEVQPPLVFAPRPNCLARRLFSDDLIEAHLDALVDAQQPDGGWPIDWLVWAPAAGLEWRGWATIEALATLRAYGRLG